MVARAEHSRSALREPNALTAFAIAAIVVIVYLLAPLPVVVIALAAFVVGAALVPLTGPLAITLSLPFSPLTRSFGQMAITPTEALIVGATGASLVRWLYLRLRSTPLASLDAQTRQRPEPHGLVPRDVASRQDRLRDLAVSMLQPARTSGNGRQDDAGILRALTAGAIALLLCGVISLVISAQFRESLRVFRLVILEPVLFYGVLVTALNQSDDRLRGARQIATMLALAGAAIGVIGIVHYVTGTNLITAEEVKRIRGFYGSPNNLGLFLDRSLPLTLGLALGTGRIASGYLALAAVQGAALLLTFSFGAWLATAVALILLAAFHGRRALLLTLGSFALIAVLALPFASNVDRIRMRFNLAEGTSFLRIQVWLAALAMLRDHPIGGIGLDNFLYYYRDRGYMLPAAWREPNLSHPHNIILDFWLSLGLTGLITFGWLLTQWVRAIIQLWQRLVSGEGRGLVMGLAAAMSASLAHGLVDNSYFLMDLAVLFWASFAIVGVLSVRAGREDGGYGGVPQMSDEQ